MEESAAPANATHLRVYYGATCRYTAKATPLIAEFERKRGVTLAKREVWANAGSAAAAARADAGRCGGVPLFHNALSNKIICGAPRSLAQLEEWEDRASSAGTASASIEGFTQLMRDVCTRRCTRSQSKLSTTAPNAECVRRCLLEKAEEKAEAQARQRLTVGGA